MSILTFVYKQKKAIKYICSSRIDSALLANGFQMFGENAMVLSSRVEMIKKDVKKCVKSFQLLGTVFPGP